MENTFSGKITKIKHLKPSYLGNPNWSIELTSSNGNVLAGRTATNSSLGYWLSTSAEGRLVTFTYHVTKGGKVVFDSKVE